MYNVDSQVKKIERGFNGLGGLSRILICGNPLNQRYPRSIDFIASHAFYFRS